MKKVTIIGAGNVGSSAAVQLANRGICNIMLIDIAGDLAKGKAVDISQSIAYHNSSVLIEGSNDFSKMKESDVIVITAGIARKPGMTRDDLKKINISILKEVCESIKKYSKDSIVIVVSNPLDVMTNVAYDLLDKNSKKIMGMGGSLDTLRLISKIRKRYNVSGANISPMVIGEHGGEMVVVPEYTTINGIPLTKVFDEKTIDDISKETINGGLEIVEYLKNGSAYFGPGEAIAIMVESIVMNKKRIVCTCAKLNGEYGINDLLIGVPVILGKSGVEKVIELDLSDESKKKFNIAVKSLREKLV